MASETPEFPSERLAAVIQKLEALDEIIEIQCNLWQANLLDILRDIKNLSPGP